MVLHPDDVARLNLARLDTIDHPAQCAVLILAGPAGSAAIRISINKLGFQFGSTLPTMP
jgi:hypothetical protein